LFNKKHPDYKDASANAKNSVIPHGCRNLEPGREGGWLSLAAVSNRHIPSHPCDWILVSMPVWRR